MAGCTTPPLSDVAHLPVKEVISFAHPVVVDSFQDRSRTSLAIGLDGTIYICSPRGTAKH